MRTGLDDGMRFIEEIFINSSRRRSLAALFALDVCLCAARCGCSLSIDRFRFGRAFSFSVSACLCLELPYVPFEWPSRRLVVSSAVAIFIDWIGRLGSGLSSALGAGSIKAAPNVFWCCRPAGRMATEARRGRCERTLRATAQKFARRIEPQGAVRWLWHCRRRRQPRRAHALAAPLAASRQIERQPSRPPEKWKQHTIQSATRSLCHPKASANSSAGAAD